MHAIFLLYGKKECVDFLIRDMTSQKLPIRVYAKKEDGTIEERGEIYVECQVRLLPFGLYEFIFPKEYMDAVLNTLWFDKPDSPDLAYDINREIKVFGMTFRPLDYVKKFLRIENPPPFKKDKKLMWYDRDIGIIPIGIRYDGEVKESNDTWHEAI